jgi:hypothetical protein
VNGYPFANIYEARYDVKATQRRDDINLDNPMKTLRFVATNYETAIWFAQAMTQASHFKGALVHDLELRDVRLIDADVVVTLTSTDLPTTDAGPRNRVRRPAPMPGDDRLD